MECKEEVIRRLTVETEKAIYQIEFGQIQIEITGRCNMHCHHCRAANEKRCDMPVDQIIKIVKFARQFSPNYKEIVVSGGEPLLHKNFPQVLKEIRMNGGDFVTLTTNGSLLTEQHLELIKELDFKRFLLSVSLDSLNPKEHDSFRKYKGASKKAQKSLSMVVKKHIPGVIASMRTTIKPQQICSINDLVKFAFDLGCKRISISSIHPAGRAMRQPDLWMTKDQKKRFLETIYQAKSQYDESFIINTNDPLRCLLRGSSDIGKKDEVVFDGCAAAAVTFNVGANGTMTPCALMNLPMMNIFKLSIEDITKRYQTNPIVHNMLDMNLKGKCGSCAKKYQCGGCRARALSRNGNYLSEDPDCWI